MMAAVPKVVAVVPVHNGRRETMSFLASLFVSTYPSLDVIVVDDGSTDSSADAIAEQFPQVRVLRGDGTLWWAGATNRGVESALAGDVDFILTINNDNVVEPGFLEPLVATALQIPRSLVTSKIYDFCDRSFIFSFGGIINWYQGEIRDCNNRRDKVNFDALRDCDWLHGSSTLIPVAAFKELGLFDQVNCPQYQGDAEFSLRAKRHGYRLLAEPHSVVYNRTGISSGTDALNRGGFKAMLNDYRSPFYYRANQTLYRRYCPCRPVFAFLGVRYLRLLYSIVRRRLVDRSGRRSDSR